MSKEKAIETHVETLTTEEPLLSPQRDFVLQFYPMTDVSQGCFAGRIEHVLSGQSVCFDSLATILTFLDRVLAEVTAKSKEDTPDNAKL